MALITVFVSYICMSTTTIYIFYVNFQVSPADFMNLTHHGKPTLCCRWHLGTVVKSNGITTVIT